MVCYAEMLVIRVFFLELTMPSAEEDFNKTWKPNMPECGSEFCLYLPLVTEVTSQTLRSMKYAANFLLYPSQLTTVPTETNQQNPDTPSTQSVTTAHHQTPNKWFLNIHDGTHFTDKIHKI